MTVRSNVSIDSYLPHPIFTNVQDSLASLPKAPLVAEGPPLARFNNTVARANSTTKLTAFHPATKWLETEASRHLAQMMEDYAWFSLKEIRRPPTRNFAQLLFDDELLQNSVSGYLTLLDGLDYVFDMTFHYGTNSANERIIRENGWIATTSRPDLRECTFFHFSASQARSFGTCLVRGRLDKCARVGEIKEQRQSWHLLRRYFDDIAETFAKSNELSSAQKHDLQNHLALRVLEEQGLDAVVVNHPLAAWKSLVMLNHDLMVLEFN